MATLSAVYQHLSSNPSIPLSQCPKRRSEQGISIISSQTPSYRHLFRPRTSSRLLYRPTPGGLRIHKCESLRFAISSESTRMLDWRWRGLLVWRTRVVRTSYASILKGALSTLADTRRINIFDRSLHQQVPDQKAMCQTRRPPALDQIREVARCRLPS